MSERHIIICPLIDNNCLLNSCAFWDGKADDSPSEVAKGKCILVRAAFALSTHER